MENVAQVVKIVAQLDNIFVPFHFLFAAESHEFRPAYNISRIPIDCFPHLDPSPGPRLADMIQAQQIILQMTEEIGPAIRTGNFVEIDLDDLS